MNDNNNIENNVVPNINNNPAVDSPIPQFAPVANAEGNVGVVTALNQPSQEPPQVTTLPAEPAQVPAQPLVGNEIPQQAPVQAPVNVTPQEIPQVENNINPLPVNQTSEVGQTPNLPSEDEPIVEFGSSVKSSKKIMLFILLIVVGVGVWYYFNESGGGGGKEECTQNLKFEASMETNGTLAIGNGDTQYLFDSSQDTNFIKQAISIDDIEYKICYTGSKDVNFHVASTTKSKQAKSIEFYDPETKQKINAKDMNTLLTEMGYHGYGYHTEEAKVVSIDYFSIEIELKSGKVVEADLSDNSLRSQLQEGQTYTFEFDVQEDTLDGFKYVINFIK